MRKIKLLMLLLSVVCMVAFTAPTYAAISYTDEAIFLTAIQAGYYLENFDIYTYGSYIASNLSLSANGYSYTMFSNSGVYSCDSAMSTGGSREVLTINFTGNPVTAIGGLFGPSDTAGSFVAGSINLTLSDGTALTNYYLNVGDFLGFTSNTPINSMTISSLTDADFPTVDQFYVGSQASQVPIPAAVWLLGSGLLGLAGLRRKFRK